MKTRVWILGLLLSCAHAKTTDQGAENKPESGESKGADTPQVVSSRPVGATPKSIFKEGAIEKLQRALSAKGYETKATGDLDDPTRNMLIKFQRAEKIAPTGMPDKETMRRLGIDPDDAEKKGSKTKE